jgi:hypothetical protein
MRGVSGLGSICELFGLLTNLLANIPKHGILSWIIYWSYHFGQYWAKVNILYIQKLRQCDTNTSHIDMAGEVSSGSP